MKSRIKRLKNYNTGFYQVGGSSGLENVIPIFQSVGDYEQHLARNGPKYGINTTTENGQLYCNIDGECFQQANTFNDKYLIRLGVPSSEQFKKNARANYSVNRAPTEQEKQQYSYFVDDSKTGSFDSWDVLPHLKKQNPGLIIYSNEHRHRNPFAPDAPDYGPDTQTTGLDTHEFLNKYGDKITVGTRIQLGAGPEIPTHTAIVVGFQQDGTPLIYDYNNIRTIHDNMYGSSLKSVKGAVLPSEDSKLTFKYLKSQLDRANAKSDFKYLSEAQMDQMPTAQGPVKASKEYRQMHDALVKESNKIKTVLNLSDEKYDELARTVLTLAGNETKYGTSAWYGVKELLNGIADSAVKSDGVTSLRSSNIESLFPTLLSDGKGGISKEKLRTIGPLLYAYKLDQYTQKMRQDDDPDELRILNDTLRNTYGSNSKEVLAELRGRSAPEGYHRTSPFSRNTYTLDGETVKLPRQMFASDQEYDRLVTDILRQRFGRSDLKHSRSKTGQKMVSRVAAGNQIPNTTVDNILYGWQSPRKIKNHDATVDNRYYRQNRENFEKIKWAK